MIYNLNLFYVSDISAAGEIRGYPLKQSIELPQKLDYAYFNDTIEKGQIILVAFKFDCNLDYSLKNCKPEISFQRIDDAVFSSGFVYYILIINRISVIQIDIMKMELNIEIYGKYLE